MKLKKVWEYLNMKKCKNISNQIKTKTNESIN